MRLLWEPLHPRGARHPVDTVHTGLATESKENKMWHWPCFPFPLILSFALDLKCFPLLLSFYQDVPYEGSLSPHGPGFIWIICLLPCSVAFVFGDRYSRSTYYD